jgi:hypothetical protein
MNNSVCDLELIYNPSKKYANTVNLVFFRAIPITKSFHKYIDGLKKWKQIKKHFPD